MGNQVVNMISSLAKETNSVPIIFDRNKLGFLCNNEKLFFEKIAVLLLKELFAPEKPLDKNNLDKLLILFTTSLSTKKFGNGAILYINIPILENHLKYLPFLELSYSEDEKVFDLLTKFSYKKFLTY